MKKIILGAFFMLAFGCKTEPPKLASMEEEVKVLASDEFKGRETGTEEEKLSLLLILLEKFINYR